MASVNLIKNVDLNQVATGHSTSTTNEPTAASFLDHAFMTGNNFCSHSSDGGETWTFVDPHREFPDSAGGFGDPKVLHDRMRNLWILVFQSDDINGANFFCLAVSTSGSPGPGNWTSWVFTPDQFDSTWATHVMFDRPDIATSNNNLYLTYTVARDRTPFGSLVIKFPLRHLANLNPASIFYFTEHGALCLTRGATTDMYFMAANTENPLTIFRLPDAEDAVMTSFRVSPRGEWAGSLTGGSFSSPGPGGAEWLAQLDSRPMAGWITGSRVGFLWSALPTNARPQPWLKAMVVDTNTQAVVLEPDIFTLEVAWAYPSTFPNVNGRVGISLFYGGGGVKHPVHVVGFLEGVNWVFAATRASTHEPFTGRWGDYCGCETHHPDATEWVAAGYTLQGGSSLNAVEPVYARFGVGP
ncbi:MAG: hypothetical protein V7603_4632 [Micromonosporaceae bacterium]